MTKNWAAETSDTMDGKAFAVDSWSNSNGTGSAPAAVSSAPSSMSYPLDPTSSPVRLSKMSAGGMGPPSSAPSPAPSPLLAQKANVGGGVVMVHKGGAIVENVGIGQQNGCAHSSVVVHTSNHTEPIPRQKDSVPRLPMEDEDSGSDAEVSKIDFTSHQVNMRNKKKRGEEDVQEQERPMSWEGELSDGDLSQMDDASANNGVPNVECKQEPEDISMEGIQTSPGSPLQSSPAEEKPDTRKLAEEWNERSSETNGNVFRSQQNVLAPPPPILPPPDYPTDPVPLQLTDRILGYAQTPTQSPLQPRHLVKQHPAPPQAPTPSPDSAIHSAYYSPTQSPVQSRHLSGFSSPYSHRTTPSLSRNNSDASQYGGSQHSYSSTTSPMSPTQFSPTHSPVQSRHLVTASYSSPVLNRSTDFVTYSRGPSSPLAARHGLPGSIFHSSGHRIVDEEGKAYAAQSQQFYGSDTNGSCDAAEDLTRDVSDDKLGSLPPDLMQHSALAAQAGISRQQLINSPCPICGDKISGFHYGIFSCESCKGFFKRTVQNRKNYVCLRGCNCPVAIATRKKCPACRFDKCLKMGMKLEAIREDRTRGGRSTYQCSYTLPASLAGVSGNDMGKSNLVLNFPSPADVPVKVEKVDGLASGSNEKPPIPPLLQEIMDVDHLWYYNDQDMQKMTTSSEPVPKPAAEGNTNPDYVSNLCNIADHRLYKIVKWCKSLPLFKNIQIDDQTSLLINTWCELLLFSCCYRSMGIPGAIRISGGKSLALEQARALGLGPCIERMLNFTKHLRRLKVDKYEYVAMKVIVLLASDASGLKEPEKVRASQEKVLQCLQQYTLNHYADMPSKFGELLLRIPDLQRTCQVGKEMLTTQGKDSEMTSFDLLMELLRGDH